MRTKTLLLAAVLAALGSASSFAQVYSVNAVGYVNVTVNKGYNIIANQLNGASAKLADLIPAAADGSTAFKYTAQNGFVSETFIEGLGWSGGGQLTFAPGEAMILNWLGNDGATATLVGEVPQGTALTVNLTQRQEGTQYFSLLSSIVPQSVGLDTIGLPTADGDTIFLYDNPAGAAEGYYSYTYIDGLGWSGPAGKPATPTPKVGEGFWMVKNTAGAVAWTRSFSVNTP